jgi:hypothetical protein
MKRKIYSIILCGITATLFSSCDLFKMDNYDEPKETLKGEVRDAVTGDLVLTDQDSQGIRIRMRELSWTASESLSNYDFYVMKEGIYNNSKIFKGHYNIRIDGPFIPLVRVNTQGDTIADESKYIDIKGVTVVDWKVQPFLKIEWVGEPVINSNSTITASFKVSRAVSAEDFKAKIEPMGGWNNNFLEVQDVRMFISETSYVGRANNATAYYTYQTYTGNNFETNTGFGNTITWTSGTIPRGRTVFVRIAARLRYSTESQVRYNYNAAIRVDMPQ